MQKLEFNPIQLQKDMNKLKFSYEVAKKYNCHKETILRKARKFNLTWPSIDQTTNHKFFSKWSRPMAYITGFITGDGCIHPKRPYLNIELKSSDIEVLEYIKSYLKEDANIYICKRSNSKISWESSKLVIFSYEIISDLKKYSIFPNKTGRHKLDFHIPKKYLGDYIRGFFDADGSVFYRYRNINSKIVCKSKDFIYSLWDKINNIGTFLKDKNLYRIYCCYKDSLKFRDIIYNNEEFALKRKKDRFFNPRLS